MTLIQTLFGNFLQSNFMQNALLAVLLVTPLFGILGTMVVSNRMAFFSDSLGHGAFTGLALGVLLGGVSPLGSLIFFSVLFSLLITWVQAKSGAATDTIIGVFSSLGVALGLIMMGFLGGVSKFSTYLVGDLLSVSRQDVFYLLLVFIAVLVLWAFLFNPLLVFSINPSFARSRGIHALGTEALFAATLAVVVAVSIQWVGLLIINAILVLPAAAARNVAWNVKSYHAFSVLIALFSGLVGLFLAYRLNLAAGAAIVVIAGIIFFVTLALKPYLQH